MGRIIGGFPWIYEWVALGRVKETLKRGVLINLELVK
jgi:hypothetical protein